MWLRCSCVAAGMDCKDRHLVSLQNTAFDQSMPLQTALFVMLLLTNPFIYPWSSGNRLVFGRKLFFFVGKGPYNHFYITDLAWGSIKIPSLINISARIWTEFSKSEFKSLVWLNSCCPLSQIFRSALRNSKRWLHLFSSNQRSGGCLMPHVRNMKVLHPKPRRSVC